MQDLVLDPQKDRDRAQQNLDLLPVPVLVPQGHPLVLQGHVLVLLGRVLVLRNQDHLDQVQVHQMPDLVLDPQKDRDRTQQNRDLFPVPVPAPVRVQYRILSRNLLQNRDQNKLFIAMFFILTYI